MINRRDYFTILEQVELAVDWTLGGYENAISDGQMRQSDFPLMIDLVEEIYSELQVSCFGHGAQWMGGLAEVIETDKNLLKGMIALAIMREHCV